jgi:antitoxin CcdA
MTERATFTLDDDAFAFLHSAAGANRSAYINQLLKAEKRRVMERKLQQANQEEAQDSQYQCDLAEWENTLSDGLSQ